MVTKTNAQGFVFDERTSLFREIIGIALALVAVLLALSLISEYHHANWIGPIGSWVAGKCFFLLGRYVSFALPAMLGLCSIHILRGALPMPSDLRAWLRGVGGLLLLVSACGLLTLTAPEQIHEAHQAAFERGGLLGNVLVSDQGLRLAELFGPVGAYVLLGGLMVIGLVMFTETLLRDLVAMGWSNVRRGIGPALKAGWRVPKFSTLWVRVPRAASDSRGTPMGFWPCMGQAVRVTLWILNPRHLVRGGACAWHALERMLAGVDFSHRRPQRTMPLGPILELGPVGELETPRQNAAEPSARNRAESRGRSSAIFPRSTAGEQTPKLEMAAIALEQALDRGPDLQHIAREQGSGGAPVQSELALFPAEYQLPPLELLSAPPDTIFEMSEEHKQSLSRKIEQTLEQFKVHVEVAEVVQGPVITRFALKVAPGVRVNRIQNLDSELSMALKAQHVRILAPIPGQSAVGIEVPNKRPNPVMLKELLDSEAFRKAKSPLSFALGKNIAGEPIICDLTQMPHLLIAGTTGSGKSVCLNSIIASMLYRNKPNDMKFVMIDPKRVELSIYQAIPHLIAPVVCETRKAAAALAWCVEQMEQRYHKLASVGVRNIDGYNELLRHPTKKSLGQPLEPMPHIVVIIDELADLMMVARNEVEEYVIRLAQMARAVGMHLIIATQRPSVNVITGIIKANFPSRIAFQVSSKVDSRTILDMNGAEALMGRGDMLYSPGGVKPFRLQGAFVADAEVERLADFIREQEKARYQKEDFEAKPTPAERAKAQIQGQETFEDLEGNERDAAVAPGERRLHGEIPVQGRASEAPLTPADMESLSDEDLYEMALHLILESRKASVSYIQRRMKIGYARAGRIMDLLEDRGIVGPYQGSKPRDLLVDPSEYKAGSRREDT